MMERFALMRRAGITFRGKRDAYEIYGYDRILTVQMYRDRYARGGVAGRIIEALPKAAWRGDMEIIEDEDPSTDTPFEKAWVALDKRLKLHDYLLRTNMMARLGSYAVLLLGAPGDVSTELPRASGKNGADKLMFVSPYQGGGGPTVGAGASRTYGDVDADATIESFDQDPSSPRFALPMYYRLKRMDIQAPELRTRIHWSRVIHVAEGLLDNDIYGQPALEKPWNLLDDLEKVTGGGAEAFFLRANQGLHLDIDKTMELEEPERKRLKDNAEEYHHHIKRLLVTRGVNVNALGSDVANFASPADAVLIQIAGTTGIPKRILTGSEMGELASSQDRDNWKDQVDGYQKQFVGPYIIRQLIDRLVQYGYLPEPVDGPLEYTVRWPHIQNLTEQEKFAGAQAWATVNATAGMTVFTEDEIRDKWYGLAPLDKSAQEQDVYRAELAAKMAMTNKTQGVTIFTTAEIRDTAYGWAPLPPGEEVPIGAPERISVTAPPSLGTDTTSPPDASGGIPLAPVTVAAGTVATLQLIQTLETALREKDLETVAAVIAAADVE
jgi:hypothetical protein